MKKKPFIIIIILNYNSLDDTIECVENINRLTYNNYDYLVIDNGPDRDSSEKLRDAIGDKNLLVMKRNTGYAEGNNIGFRYALKRQAEYVLIVNPDVRLQPESLAEYVDIMEGNPEIGALNPVQLNGTGAAIDDSFKTTVLVRSAGIDPPRPEELKDQLWQAKTLYGAAILLRSSVITDVGGFDPLYFAYGEEQDLCRRILYNNYKLCVTAKSPVLHLRTHENNGMSERVLFLRLKGYYLYKLKNARSSISKELTVIFNEIKKGMNGINKYEYKYTKKTYRKVLFWIIKNFFVIYMHKKLESRPRKMRYI